MAGADGARRGHSATPPFIFESDRLVLRRPRPEDAAPIRSAYAGDPAVVRFLRWRAHADLEETRAFLRSCDSRWANGEVYSWALALKADVRRPVGMIDMRPTPHGVSFGYVLGRDHWGKGLMPEALLVLIGWALGQPDIWRAYAFCDVDNLASARVMEKAGMAFEGILRRWLVHPNVSAEPRDCRVYARVR